MKINKLLAALTALCIGWAMAPAQNTTMTPYSKYGYGMLNDNCTSMQKAMGGVGYAQNSGRQINVKNPASYAAIDSLTFLFDMGVNFDMIWSKEGSRSENNFSGGLDYITLAFPITKWIGASIGMLPYSTVGYTFNNTIDNGSVTRTGQGSINLLYAGVGFNPIGGFYVGTNISYMFGSITNDVYAYTSNSSTSLFQRFMEVRDYHLDFGVQYTRQLSQDNSVTVGLTFAPGKHLRGNTYGLYYDMTSSTSVDTVGYTSLKNNSIPATYGAGVNYKWKDRLMLECDFTYQPWSKAKYTEVESFEDMTFANRYKIALGGQYTHAPRGSYWQRVQLRAGAYYNHDYLMVRGNNVREVGAAIGFGLPVPGFKTVINLAFEYKHRQAHPNPLIKEQYFNITLGVNFNELWFRKPKIY